MSVLISVSYFVTIYIGFLVYIFGFLGSILNIYLLFSNRNNSCTFLSIYSSIVDCFVLNIGLLPRILAVGFNIDPTLYNLGWCKIRSYGLRISTLISLFTISLMSVERFFVSCRTVRWRQMGSLTSMRWATFIITCTLATEGLPFLILTDILRSATSTSCTPMYNVVFARYASFFCIPMMYGVIPLGVMIAMSILIYYQLHNRIHLRKAQRSLTLIILIRILCVLLSCGPYASYFVYAAIVSLTVSVKSADRIAIESFALGIVSVFLYITYSSSFFVYYFASPTYRQRLFDLFLCFRRRNGRVRPAPTAAKMTK